MRILVIAPSTRAIAESALNAGYKNFFTIDFFGDADTKAICENYSLKHDLKAKPSIENLFKASLDFSFTHVVYSSGFENFPELIEKFEENGIEVLGNSAENLRKARDWENLFKEVDKLGMHYPHSMVMQGSDIAELNGSFIVKPVKSGGGKGILRLKDFKRMLKNAGKKMKKVLEEKAFLVQEEIKGMPCSAIVACSAKEAFFICATEQITGNAFSEFAYSGNIAPLYQSRKLIAEIREKATEICRALGLLGINGVDFMLSKTGELFFLEINPRITGACDVIEKACNVNIFDIHVKACLNKLSEIKIKKPKLFCGKKIIYADKRLAFKLKKLPKFVKDIPHFNEKIEQNMPVCTVYASSKSLEKCKILLDTRAEMIKNQNNKYLLTKSSKQAAPVAQPGGALPW